MLFQPGPAASRTMPCGPRSDELDKSSGATESGDKPVLLGPLSHPARRVSGASGFRWSGRIEHGFWLTKSQNFG
jgi:hypothetical protein